MNLTKKKAKKENNNIHEKDKQKIKEMFEEMHNYSILENEDYKLIYSILRLRIMKNAGLTEESMSRLEKGSALNE